MDAFSTPVLLTTEWPEVYYSVPLLSIICLAGIGTTVLFLISVIAYRRRRTPQYLLIMAALCALVLQSFVGAGTVFGFVPMIAHHLIEHTLDFLIAALILYAVYRSGPDQSQQMSHGSLNMRYKDSEE